MKEIGSKLGSNFLPDKIHYQKFDSLGRVVQVLVDNDAKAETGKSLTGNDGQDIAGIDRIESYQLNVKGQAVQISYDNDADGSTDQIEHLVLNASGNWIAKYIDTDGKAQTGTTKTIDGKAITGIDKAEVYTLDSKGQIVQIEYDNDTDGISEKIEYFVRDANGNLLEKYHNTDGSESTGYTKTINGQKVAGIDSVDMYDINAKGQGVKISYDNNADGIIDSIDYVVLDASGAWLTKYSDTDPNNASGNTGNEIKISGALAEHLKTDSLTGINNIVYYTRDALGRMTSDSHDYGADGSIDYSRYIELYPNGNWKYTNVNADGDNSTGASIMVNGVTVAGIDRRELVYADSRGYTIGRHWDDNMDGEFDRFQKVVPNQNGNWVELHTDSNNDGSYERSEFYTLDQYGRTSGTTYVVYNEQVETLKTLSEITSADGRISTNSYIRDANGNTLITANDANVKDGLIDTISFSARNYEVNISDLVGSNVFALGQINKSLTRITLSNAEAETTIKLDSKTLSQISKNATVDIRGDATDTVNLSSDFTKVEGTTKRAGTDVLQAYTADVDGATYTVYIDTDVNTVIA